MMQEVRGPSGIVYKIRPLTARDFIEHVDELDLLDEQRLARRLLKVMIDRCILQPDPSEIPLGKWIKDQETVINAIADASDIPFRYEDAGEGPPPPSKLGKDVGSPAQRDRRHRPV